MTDLFRLRRRLCRVTKLVAWCDLLAKRTDSLARAARRRGHSDRCIRLLESTAVRLNRCTRLQREGHRLMLAIAAGERREAMTRQLEAITTPGGKH